MKKTCIGVVLLAFLSFVGWYQFLRSKPLDQPQPSAKKVFQQMLESAGNEGKQCEDYKATSAQDLFDSLKKIIQSKETPTEYRFCGGKAWAIDNLRKLDIDWDLSTLNESEMRLELYPLAIERKKGRFKNAGPIEFPIEKISDHEWRYKINDENHCQVTLECDACKKPGKEDLRSSDERYIKTDDFVVLSVNQGCDYGVTVWNLESNNNFETYEKYLIESDGKTSQLFGSMDTVFVKASDYPNDFDPLFWGKAFKASNSDDFVIVGKNLKEILPTLQLERLASKWENEKVPCSNLSSLITYPSKLLDTTIYTVFDKQKNSNGYRKYYIGWVANNVCKTIVSGDMDEDMGASFYPLDVLQIQGKKWLVIKWSGDEGSMMQFIPYPFVEKN